MLTDILVLNCFLIFAARIVDVSLGTLRTLFIIRGNRLVSWVLGFFEVLIWIWVVSRVIDGVREQPIYAVFYAVGFATGTVLGVTIEKWLAVGDKAVLLFTRRADDVSSALRAEGYALTELKGEGQDGPISILFMKVPRRRVDSVVDKARGIDEHIFVVIENVDQVTAERNASLLRTGWRTKGRKFK